MCYNDKMRKTKKTYTVGELAEEVNRSTHTVRLWDTYKKLPLELRAHRDETNWRFWTEEQVEGIKIWLLDIKPGSGVIKK